MAAHVFAIWNTDFEPARWEGWEIRSGLTIVRICSTQFSEKDFRRQSVDPFLQSIANSKSASLMVPTIEGTDLEFELIYNAHMSIHARFYMQHASRTNYISVIFPHDVALGMVDTATKTTATLDDWRKVE